MNDHGIIGQAGIFKTGEDRTDALINECNKAEVFLFQVSIIVDGETELELTDSSGFILGRQLKGLDRRRRSDVHC
jgi:hypothetical protein